MVERATIEIKNYVEEQKPTFASIRLIRKLVWYSGFRENEINTMQEMAKDRIEA